MSVLSSFVVVGLVFAAFFSGRRVRRAWVGRSRVRGEEWWRFWRGWSQWRIRLVDVRSRRSEEEVEDEQRPLLDAE